MAAEVPGALERALDADPDARAEFDRLPPSHQREYADWIDEAKTDETREQRAERAVTMLREGRQ